MRDLLLILILLSFIFSSFRAPYFMALGYLWIDFLQPQRLAYYVFSQLPVAMIFAVGSLAAFLFFDKEKKFRISILQVLVIFIVAYATLATFAWAEVDGTSKWDWTTKALLFSAFMPMVFTTRVRVEAALAVILFSTSAITISAGLKSVLGSTGYGTLAFLVNNNTGMYEQSTLSTIGAALVPLTWWFYKHNSFIPPNRVTFLIAAGLTGSYLIITVGTEARTGLIAIAALAGLIWWRSKQKVVIAAGMAMLALLSIPFIPQTFMDRMATITDFQTDESASTRIAVWDWTLDYVADHPQGGGFNVFRINEVEYELAQRTGEGETADVSTITITDSARAFHSSYFEVLGELGYPGFLLWGSAVIIFYVQTRRIYTRSRKALKEISEENPEFRTLEWSASFGRSASIFVPVYMAGSLFVGIAFQPPFYHVMALTIAVSYIVSEAVQRLQVAESNQISRRRAGRPRAGNPVPA